MRPTIDPLAELPELVQRKLTDAGWKPGVSRSRKAWSRWRRVETNSALSDHHWLANVQQFWDDSLTMDRTNSEPEMFARSWLARRIQEELFSLSAHSGTFTVKRNTDSPVQFARTVVFDSREGAAGSLEIRELCKLLGRLLVPVGETRSEANLLVDETGRMYLLGYVGFGMFYVGETFGEAMEALLSGRELRPVYFDETVNEAFRLPDVSRDTPNVFCPLDEHAE